VLEPGRRLDPLGEEEDVLHRRGLLLLRQRQDGEEDGLALLLALQLIGEPERVDRHVGEVDRLAELGGGPGGRLARAGSRERLDAVAERVPAIHFLSQPLRGAGVLRVHFSRRVQHGVADRLTVRRELLVQLEAAADLEDRHVDIGPVLELQERERGLAGDVAPVGPELVEQERHEVEVAALAGTYGLGRWGQHCRLRRWVLEGLPDRARVEESEPAGLLPDAVLGLDLAGEVRTVRPFLSRATTSRSTTSVSPKPLAATRPALRRRPGGAKPGERQRGEDDPDPGGRSAARHRGASLPASSRAKAGRREPSPFAESLWKARCSFSASARRPAWT
jgi:hypothetical protein